MKVGDLVRRAHSMNKTLGVIVKVTPEYHQQYHVLVGGIVQYFATRQLEVISESR